MKISTGILALLLPVTASAQNYPGMGGMSESDMQNMMQQAQKMQTCMQGIDQTRVKAFEQQASTVEARVKSLCADGKRDDAQQEAVTFAREMSSDPDIQKIMECGKMMSGMLPPMPFIEQASGKNESAGHVCDL